MTMNFDEELASALQEYADEIRASEEMKNAYKQNPTDSVVAFLKDKGLAIPELFHAHAVHAGNPLPSEPELATKDRYIYIYRNSGLFEFKRVPGSPEGDDSIMTNPKRSCCCCNCCAIEV